MKKDERIYALQNKLGKYYITKIPEYENNDCFITQDTKDLAMTLDELIGIDEDKLFKLVSDGIGIGVATLTKVISTNKELITIKGGNK